MRPGVKGTVTSCAGVLGRLLDAGAPASTIRSASDTFLPPAGRVELVLDALRAPRAPSRSCGRLVDLPVLLRRQADARAVGAAALVGAAEGGGRGPGRRDQLRHRQAGGQDLRLERGDVLVVDQRMIDGRDRVLPDQRLPSALAGRGSATRGPMSRWVSLNQARAKASANWSGLLEEAPRDLLVGRVEAQRQVGGQHRRQPLLRRVVRRPGRRRRALGLPLLGAGRALGQLPLEVEQVLEEVVAPLGRRLGPGDFRAAGDGVGADAGAVLAVPAEALVLDARRLPVPARRTTDRRRRGSCRRCGRRRSARPSPRRSSPCGRRSRGCRRAAATGSGLPFGPSGLT